MTKRVDNSTSESRLMATSPDFQIQSLKKANDEMRKHIARLKSDMEQERNKFKKLKRERVKDIRTAREQQQQQAIMAISDLKQKLHQEKSNELLAQKDTLTRQFEIEVKKLVRQKDDALGKMQSELHKTKEEFLMKTRNRVAADAQDEARKKFEMERNRLLQEISDLRDGKKKVEIMLSDISEADRRRAAEMKWKYEKHQMEVEQLKKDARRDICRLVEELKKKNRVISELDKELGYQCGHSQKLKAEKDSLKGELQNLVKMAETWERGPSPRPIPSPRPDALGRLSPDSQALEDFERERFQHKLTELIIFIRRLEVANDTLLKEKAALELKLKSPDFASERQKLLKLVEDLEQDKKRLEERCKVLNEDNFKFRGTKIPIRRQDSHSTRKSPTPETYGRLSNNSSFDNSESEQLKKQLNDHFKTITELKQQIVEKDRRLDLIQYRRQKARQRQSAILESPKGLDDEIGLDSASIASSFSQMSDNTLSGEWDEFDKAELESNYQQLSKEHLQLKKAYAQLQAMIGGSLDVQRENKLRQQLELDLLDSQAKIEDLKSIVDKQGKDSGWVEEKQKIIYDNRSLQEKITEQEDIIKKVRFDLEDSKDQNELLEFRILELEERTETLHSTTPESLLSLSPQSPGKLVKRSSLPLSSVLPEIQVAETNGHYLQIAVTEEGFTDMSVGEIKQKLEALEKDKEDDRLTSEDKKTLLGARAMLDIADLKLKKMTASESRLKRKALELEHEKDRLAAKICSLEAELRVKLSELDDSNKRVDELEDSIGKMKRTEAKFRAQEDVYLKNESKLIEDIGNLKKQMASAREGRNYENELLFQKMAEVKQEKQPETAQKVTALEKEKSKLQEKLDHLFDEHKAMASTEEDEKEPRLIELKSKMTLDELQHLKDKVGQIQAAEMKIAKMEQTELVLREHIEDLEQEVIELQQNMHDHKARYNQNIATYHERENSYKDNLRQAERSQEELREQLEMSISEESAKQKENEELKRKLTELEKSEKSLKEQIGELENDIASMHGENETDTSALRDEEADRMKVITLEASRTTLGEGSESELNKVKHENRELQDKLKVFEFSEKALKEQINQLRTENIHLQEQLKLMQNQNEKLWKSLPKNVNSDLVRTSLEKEDVLTMYREAVEEIQDLEHDGRDSTDVNMEEPSLKMSVDAVVSEDAIVKENVETVKEAPILKEMHTYILEEPIQFGNLDLGEPADQTAFEGNQKEPVFNESSGSVTMTLPESCLLSGVFVEKPIQFGSVGVQETSNLKAVEEQCSETETLNDKPIVKKTSGSATITLPKSSELLSGVVAEKPIELSRIDIQELPNMKAFEENHDNQHPKATSESESMSLPELSDLLSGVIAETSIQHGSVDLQKPADLQAIEDKPDKPIDLTLRDVEEEPHQFGKVDLQEAPNLKSLDTSPLSATKTLPRQADITESDNGLNKTKTLKRQQSLEDRIYELEASENILKQVVRDLQSNEEAWKEKNVKLNMQLSELNNKIKALEQKDKEEEQVINEMKDREIQLLEKIQEIQTEEEVQVEKERQLKEMSEKIIAAKEQNDQSNNEIKMLEESKAKLVDELNEVNSEKEEIEGKLLEARESLEEQEILLGDLRESDAKLTEHIGQLITEKDVLAEDVKDSNEKIAEQDENLTSLKTAVEQNENRIDELSVQKDELQHRLKEAYGRIEEQAIQENVLKKVIDDLQASEENMRTTVAELEESNKAFKDRMPVVAEFEKILKDTVSELEHSNETLRAKEMELDTCKSKIGETENKIEEFHAEEEALLSKVHKLENQVLQLEENEESLKKKVKSLEVDLQRREDIEVDLKEDHISEVTTLQEQIDQLEQSEKELKKKIAELSDSELNVSASHEMAHKLWKEKEGTLKNRINELEKSEDIQSGKLKELQQSESVLKEEVKKHEEVGLQTSRELYDKKKTMQDRITALEEFNKRLEDKVDELLGTEKTHKEEFEEAVKVWRQNENVLKDTVGALEEMEADLRNRLLDREQREIDLREQLDAKVRENEVSAEIWKQSEDSLNERIGKMEESEEKLLRKVEKLEQREDEMKLKVQEAEQTLKEVVESASLTYQERIQELEDIQNILKDKVSQLTEAEKNVREMLDEATLVYKQNEETLKQKVEHLEEEHGEMQGKYHELDSCKTMLMGQLEDAEKKVKDHKKGKKVLEERIIDLETEVAGLRGNLDDSQKQLVDTTRVEKEFHAQLSQQLESVQFERKANEKNLKEKVQDLLEHESELQNKVYELETATHLLEDQVGSAKVENKRLRETNDAIKEQAEELEDEGRQLRRKLKDAEEKVEDLEKTEAELRDRLKEREASEEIRQLEEKRTLDDMNKKISELQTSEEHLKDEVSFLEKSSQKLKQKIDEKNNDIGKVFEQRTKEKDDFRRKIQDLEESEIMMKEKLFELGLDMKKKEWELERIEPHVKFQTEQIQDATHQEVRHKEMTNTLRKRIEQLENRERELKSKVEDLEDFQTPLKDRASKAEKREKELQEKVEKLQKSELNLESEIVSLEKQLEMGRNKENEKLQERVMELEDSESTLKSNLAKSERSEKILQKAHKTLEEDFMYLQEEECKLREKMKQLEKDYDLIKKSKRVEIEQLASKITAMENTDKYLQKKLLDAKKSEETLQKELLTAEEAYDKTENSLRQTIKAFERNAREMEDRERELRQKVQDVEREDKNLKQKVKKLENAEESLKDELSGLENKELDLRHRVRELESSEKMLKMDNNQLKHEKDLLNEKVAELKESQKCTQKQMDDVQRNESKLKEMMQELEKHGSLMRDKITEMEANAMTLQRRSTQAAELEQELANTQEELQIANLKAEQLERAKSSLKRQLENLEDDLATGQMVSLPLDEFKRMKAQTTLLEMTEQNVEDLEKAEARLQDRLRQVEGEKDYTDADKEVLNLRCQLEEKDKELKESREKLSDAQTHLRTAQRQISELRNNHTVVRRELRDLQESLELQEREEALEEKGKQCRSLRTENTQLHTEFRDKNSQITSLKAEVMRLERLLKMNKTDEAIVNELREELDKIHRQLSLKEDEVKSSVDMATMYRTKLDRRDKELAAKEGAVEEKMGEIQKLRQEMGRLEQQNRLQQSAAESKYKDLVAKLESVKRELMGKCNELENTMQEIARLEEELNELRNKLKDLDNIQSERDMLQGKLQAAEMALKNKAEQEIRLLDQLTMLQMKVEDCEKLKETRDGIEDSYRDIKLRFDDMEHKKQEALLAVAPLKAKVSRLVKKCKERDIVINRLAKELTQQYGGRSSELLDAVVRLQSRMQDEEYNEPMTPYSTSLPGIHGEPELTVERPEVSVESSLRSSPMGEASRQTPNLSENVINELSEPLWQAIERTSPGLGRSPAPSNQEITSDEAAMEVLLQSLGSNGAAAGDSTTHAASSDRTSPRNALEDLLATDPELARMLERGTSGRHSSHSDRDNLLQGIGSIETTRERRTTPRRQRVKDIPHLSQSPEEILRMHDVLQECRPEHKLLNYEPSPLLAEEQLNNIPSPYPNGLPLTSSSTPSFPPSPLTFPGASPSRLTPGSLSSISPVHYGTFPSGVARLSNGTLPLLQNWGVLPAYQRSVDTPDMASYSVGSTSSTVSPANSGMHPLAMLPPSSLQLEGPPQPPTDFRISRIVTSRSILLAWIPPAMDEMAKSNGAQVAGYKIYLNNRQKQLVNSAHLTKALIENIHVRSPMTFSIETVTVTGQTSHRAEAYFPGSVSSPTLSESMLSDSAADTEVSSILSDVTEPRKRTFIAIYSYNPAEHSPNDYPAFELVFKEGDIITVYGSMRSDGFFHGKLRGKKGLVPSNFVEEIHVSGSKGLRKKKSNSIQNGSSTPSDISRQKTGRNSRPSSGKVSWSGARV
ncbi:uncharacterized protein LOC144446976 isoform X7 [Glandiceps talaboti]